jgi:hypothetical protein
LEEFPVAIATGLAKAAGALPDRPVSRKRLAVMTAMPLLNGFLPKGVFCIFINLARKTFTNCLVIRKITPISYWSNRWIFGMFHVSGML